MNIKVVPHKIYYALLNQVRNNSRKVLSSDNPEFLHDLRVNVLKLEFVSKFFSEFIRMNKRSREQLKSAQFQNVLGKRQDAVGAIAVVSNSASAKGSKKINRFIKIEKNIIKDADKKFDKIWQKHAHTAFSSFLPFR